VANHSPVTTGPYRAHTLKSHHFMPRYLYPNQSRRATHLRCHILRYFLRVEQTREMALGSSSPLDGSIFATGPNELHRVRRAAVDPFFSTQNVRKLQPVIQELADKVVSRLREFRETGEVIHGGAMFAAYSNDKSLPLIYPSTKSK
jgi:cytochrome P450